jgi:hypothetical protein
MLAHEPRQSQSPRSLKRYHFPSFASQQTGQHAGFPRAFLGGGVIFMYFHQAMGDGFIWRILDFEDPVGQLQIIPPFTVCQPDTSKIVGACLPARARVSAPRAGWRSGR